MDRKILIIISILLIGFLLGGITYWGLHQTIFQEQPFFTPNAPKQIQETNRAFSEIVKVVSPSVVNISNTKILKRPQTPFGDFFNFSPLFKDIPQQKFKEQSMGSGVIVSTDGYIVTNNHVVEQSSDIKVTLFDKQTLKAKIIGSDPKTDIAIIKIDTKNLPITPFGNSENLQVGEFVLAIGNPFGLNNTVTMGIISAVGRADVGIAEYEDFIQTDAAINPGNSGGPLVNIKGEIVGINTAIFSKTGGYQGIGFAVPSNMVKAIMEQLLKNGKVTRGWMGVTIQDIKPDIAQKFGIKSTKGVLIIDVIKNSPAQKAGFIRGDIVLEFGGKTVIDGGSFRNMVSQTKIGSTVYVKIWRKGKEMTLRTDIEEVSSEKLELLSRIPQGKESYNNALSGISVINLSSEITRQLGVDGNEKGVVVVDIEQDSPAEVSGIRKGDIIQEIDKQRITNINDFNKSASKIKEGDSILLFINRSGKKFYVVLEAI